jgi:hypothetical protein
MKDPTCLAFVSSGNLHLQPDLEAIFKEKGVSCYFLKQGDPLTQLAKTWAPFMLLVDLTGQESEWIFRHIAQLEETFTNFPVVAVVKEIEDAVHRRAESCGCRFVLSEENLIEKLPDIIEDIIERKI